ncbi:MAG: hypothetical protein DI616_12375 [Paracoccus denitrificans]|uniref:Knr4/Smi1-like domain-containing protein n=1 Tax=Paracoccus denitrificans TaxID=266 RepID=A0A533I8F0_PARDE|nr:MAG: hypothetical protein DI616_12375 [Paracoccus denitrificans]
MDKKKLAVVLRLGFGAVLVLYAAGLGFSHRTPWFILPLTLAFSVLYIAGKWPAWRQVWQDGGVGRALPPVVAIQAMLAGILYLTGLGLGRLISPQPMTQTVSASDLTGLALVVLLGLGVSVAIGRLEAAPDPEHLRETPQPGTAAELTILPGPVTAANMFGPYQGTDDFARAALTRQNDKKPVRQPKAANDLALDAAEARLGFVLPDGLRAIYKVKNGGSAPDLVVPKRPQPRPLNEDWADAFGGYEELYSLERLRTVHDSVLDYAHEDEADAFPEGARQMLVLAQWYRETTLLDYRHGDSPRLGLVDFDREGWQEEGVWFDDFAAFLSALRHAERDELRTRPPRDLAPHGPSVDHPDAFWMYGASFDLSSAADHGVDDELWQHTEARLGVMLPQALRPWLAVSNGGAPAYHVLPDQPGDADQPEGLNPFPAGHLFGIHQWITLHELSERLEFTAGFTPWSQIWDGSERLIVLSASFDTALMLDYRRAGDPRLLHVANLDDPASALDLGTAAQFLNRLRGFARPYENERSIGDDRLSARAPRPETFWMPDGRTGLDPDDVAHHEERLGLEFPRRLKEWMIRQDGGRPRFRFVPPVMPNAHGYPNPVISADTWLDLFPDGILPMGKWRLMADWLTRHPEDLGDALRLRGHGGPVRDEFGNTSKIILLAEAPDRLTLLDTSRDIQADHAMIVQLARKAEGWVETYRSATMRVFAPRALRSDVRVSGA